MHQPLRSRPRETPVTLGVGDVLHRADQLPRGQRTIQPRDNLLAGLRQGRQNLRKQSTQLRLTKRRRQLSLVQ